MSCCWRATDVAVLTEVENENNLVLEGWRLPARVFCNLFLLYPAIVILTFTYFIPRDLILFTWPIQDHIEEIRTAASQWSEMNWLRTLL